MLYFGISALSPKSYEPAPAQAPATQDATQGALPDLPGNPAAALRGDGLTIENAQGTDDGLAAPRRPRGELAPATASEVIAYRAAMPKTISLGTAPVPAPDAEISSYPNNLAIIAERPSASVPTSAWAYDMKKKTLKALVSDERGAMITLSQNGAFALVGHAAQAGNAFALEFIDMKKGSRLPIRFTTLPPKCAIADDKPMIYCGIPAPMPERTVLPDDYLMRALYTDDRVVAIDIESAEVSEIMPRKAPFMDVWRPLIVSKALIFENRKDGSFWKLSL